MNQDSSPPPKTKICLDCWANLPVSCYGLKRTTKDGYTDTCKECRAEWSKFDYTKKYGRVHKMFNPDVIRGVMRHNRNLVEACINQKVALIGYCPHDNKRYRADFGRNRYDMQSFSIFREDGSVYEEYVYSGSDLEESKEKILQLLKIGRIRLELSTAEMVASKNVVYYFSP